MLFLRSLLFCSGLASVYGATIPTPTTLITLSARQDTVDSGSLSTAAPTGVFMTTKHVTIDGVTNDHVTIPAKTIDLTLPTCVQTIEPDENGYLPPGSCNAIWNYYPSFSAAVALAVMFALLMGVHVWQAARYKKTWCWVIIMASLWETLAFTFRALSSKNQTSDGIYLVFQIFILLAPLWVNAFIYMTFGRMVYFFHPSRAILRIPASTFAAVFVGLDIISFIIQLVGGGQSSPSAPPADQLKAVHIYMGGIGLQEFFIVVFLGLCIVFQRQMTALGGSSPWYTHLARAEWGPLMCTLYLALLMISIRIIYRLIEFSGGLGQNNALTTHEAYFYVLEAAPMLIALAAFNIIHPGRIITGPGSEMPGIITTIKLKFARRKGKQLIADESSGEEEMPTEYEMRRPSIRR